MEPPALLSADHVFSFETSVPFLVCENMAWSRDRDWNQSSWKTSSSWDKTTSSGWNNRDWQRDQPSVPSPSVSIPSTFVSDWECYDTNLVSNKKFFFVTFSQPHGPPRMGWPAKMLPAFESQTSREKVWTTTASDACPAENFKASFL